MKLEHLFEPEAIAIVGASQTEGKIGYEAILNDAEFGGCAYQVNPLTSGSVFGEPFVESVSDVGDTTARLPMRTSVASSRSTSSVTPSTEVCGDAERASPCKVFEWRCCLKHQSFAVE